MILSADLSAASIQGDTAALLGQRRPGPHDTDTHTRPLA